MNIPILTVYDNDGNEVAIPAIQGPIGPIGPQGEKGETGQTGEKGEQGKGLTISGSYSSVGQLPVSADIGTAYLVGTGAPYNVYIYGLVGGSLQGQWINAGQLQGAKGDKGDKGDDGEDGTDGTNGSDGSDGISITNAVVNSSGNLIITLSNQTEINAGYVKGAKGDTGNTGATGPQGPQGPAGADGTDGTDGVNAYIKIRNVVLYSNGWSGNGPWTQTVSIAGVGNNTQVNCCPSNANIEDSITGGYALAVVNNNGVVTFYAIGDKPTLNISLQVALYETEA